jgi:hypothetical protein
MEPITFEITLTDEIFASRAGLALVGRLLGRTQLRRRLDALSVSGVSKPVISHGEVGLSMLGLLCLARPDFSAIEDEEPAELLSLGLGLDALPSEETLRQRLDQIGAGCLAESLDIVRECSAALVGSSAPAITPCLEHGKGKTRRRWVALDIDVSPFDNSNTNKQGVSRTYKGFDGYAPIFAYLGQEGYLMNIELREGSQHCQNGTVAFMRQTLEQTQPIMQATQRDASLLVRLDAGNDDIENVELCRKAKGVDFIIKRNLRRENVDEWLEIAVAHGTRDQPREGKTVWRGDHWLQRDDQTYRVVFEVTERTIDKHGQQLLVPDVQINTWWTSLPPTKVSASQVIELYHQHGTSEQFHSELKSDLDLERLPSGKFNTNALVLGLGMLAYNALRLIGQCVLDEDKKLPPDQKPPLKRVAKCGHKPRMKRRRLRRVIQDLMYLSAKLVRTGRRWCLRLSRCNPWSVVCRALYLRLTPV